MYLARLKTAFVTALTASFSDSYSNQDFRNMRVGIEYPLEAQQYPSIWVTYDDRDPLQIASIDHREFVLDADNNPHEVTRWTFAGTVTFTAVALSSLERDNLYDELVRTYAFGRVEDGSVFRDTIENNAFVGIVVNWDEARPGGDAAAPGTPWGTDDEVIYEKSLSFDVEGEFVSDPATQSLLRLSAILTEATLVSSEGLPVSVARVAVPNTFDPTGWH